MEVGISIWNVANKLQVQPARGCVFTRSWSVYPHAAHPASYRYYKYPYAKVRTCQLLGYWVKSGKLFIHVEECV